MGVIYLTKLKTMTREMYGRGEFDRHRYYHVRATVDSFKSEIDDVVYQGCPLDNCKKKVQPTKNGKRYKCEKCNKRYSTFQYRYKLKVYLNDGSRRPFLVTMFDETAEPFLEISAPDLVEVYDNDPYEYESFFDKMLNETFYFKLKVALVCYGDEDNLYTRLSGIVREFELEDDLDDDD